MTTRRVLYPAVTRPGFVPPPPLTPSFDTSVPVPQNWGKVSARIQQTDSTNFVNLGAPTPNPLDFDTSTPLFQNWNVKSLLTQQTDFFAPIFPPTPGPASADIESISANPISSFPISGARTADSIVTATNPTFATDAFIKRTTNLIARFDYNFVTQPSVTVDGYFQDLGVQFRKSSQISLHSLNGFVNLPFKPYVFADNVTITKRKSINFDTSGFVTPTAFQPYVFSDYTTTQVKSFKNLTTYDAAISPPIVVQYYVFSESPLATVPRKPLQEVPGISFLQIAYTPSFWSWSESPSVTIKPHPLEYAPFQYPSVPVVQYYVFSELSQAILPRKPLQEVQGFSFLQIAYTPSALTFSEYPFTTVKIKQTPTLEEFVSFQTTFTWGWASQNDALRQRSAAVQDSQGFASNQTVQALTPNYLSFSDSPITTYRINTQALTQNNSFIFQPTVTVTSRIFSYISSAYIQ